MKQKMTTPFPINRFAFIFIFLLSFHFSFAQEDHKESFTENKSGFMMNLGLYQPLGFGNNIAGKTMNQQPGINYSLLYRIPNTKILAGSTFYGFKSTVKKSEISKTGNYDKSLISFIGLQAGYIFWENPTWLAYINGSFGYVQYRNKSSEFNFKDEGSAIHISPTINYKFHKNFSVYSAISYRHDFLNIKAPAEIKDLFKNQDYITFSLGISLLF